MALRAFVKDAEFQVDKGFQWDKKKGGGLYQEEILIACPWDGYNPGVSFERERQAK